LVKPVKNSEEAKKRVNIARSRYDRAYSAMAAEEQKWVQLDRFMLADQWNTEGMPAWMPKPVTNFIFLGVTVQRANLSVPKISPIFRPVEQGDTENAQRFQRLTDFTIEKADLTYETREAWGTALLKGTAYTQVYLDHKEEGGSAKNKSIWKGLIKYKTYDPVNWKIDPMAYRIENARWAIKDEKWDIEAIKNDPRFKQFCQETGQEERLKNLDSGHKDHERENPYFRSNKTSSLGDGATEIVLESWEKFVDEDGVEHLICEYIAGDVLLLQLFDPFKLEMEDQVYNCVEIPVATLYEYSVPKRLLGMSGAMQIIEKQKLVNRIEQLGALIVLLNSNPQKVVLRESGIKPEEVARDGMMPGKVWYSHIPKGIEYIQPPELPQSLFKFLEMSKQDIRDILGLNQAYLGESVGSLTTSTGVNSLIGRATIRDKDKFNEMNRYMRRLMFLTAKFQQIFYNEERKVRILGEDNQFDFEGIRGSDYVDLDLDIHIDVTEAAPLTQETLKQEANELLNIQGQYQFDPPVITPEEFIEMSGFKDRDTILNRMKAQRSQNKIQEALEVLQIGLQAIQSGQDPTLVIQQYVAQKEQNGGKSPASQEATLSQGVADSSAMGAMTNGR
jgi:hypothetical protein